MVEMIYGFRFHPSPRRSERAVINDRVCPFHSLIVTNGSLTEKTHLRRAGVLQRKLRQELPQRWKCTGRLAAVYKNVRLQVMNEPSCELLYSDGEVGFTPHSLDCFNIQYFTG